MPAEVNTTPAVFIEGLSKTYAGITVVDHINLSINQGTCFGFLGPNGAGKTTSLRMLLGLTPIERGRLEVFGIDIRREPSRIRARMGVVPQTDNLDPDFSVRENLIMYAAYFGYSRRSIRDRVEALLHFAALTDRADTRTDTLSGGMQRRLAIARALVNDPELVVLDEPTTGLDPQARHVIWERLTSLREQGKTLILTTHYMEEAERLCDELVIMDHGRILAQGSPAELIERHVEPEVVEIRSTNGAGAFEPQELPGIRIERHGNSLYCYGSDMTALLDRLGATGSARYQHRRSGLEDVFLRLTGRELRD